MIRVACIQIAPVFLNAKETWLKLKDYINEAANDGAELITWGETLIPGYPVWLSPTCGATFNDPDQKRAYATYWRESLLLDGEIVSEMATLAGEHKVMLMGGIAERDVGSTYCTLLTFSSDGCLLGRHRKIKPTFEERLVWADGDSLGLKTYPLKDTVVGGLNCWENWLPMARASLHLQGEMIHVALWPGSYSLTQDISRFIALEGRSWVVSTSGLIRPSDFSHLSHEDFPMRDRMMEKEDSWQNGGSIIINPKGEAVAGPLLNEEGILYADVDPLMAVEERQNLDISGNYSRWDIFNKPLK